MFLKTDPHDPAPSTPRSLVTVRVPMPRSGRVAHVREVRGYGGTPLLDLPYYQPIAIFPE